MSYKGLCVGGVLAGEWVSKDTMSFTERHFVGRAGRFHGPIRIHWSTESIMDGTAGLVTNYVHVSVDEVCEFWVPEGKNVTWAMQELVRCYRQDNLPSSWEEAAY